MSRTSRALASLFLGLAGAVLLVSPASAHATLVSVDPKDGSTTADALTKVSFTFDENIRAPSKIVVTGPHGQRVSHGATSVLDNVVSVQVSLEPRPEDVGSYTAAFRVVSADGHPVTGESTFTYAPPGVTASAPDPTTAQATSSGGGRTWWIVGGVAVVLLAVVLLLPLLRTRGRPR